MRSRQNLNITRLHYYTDIAGVHFDFLCSKKIQSFFSIRNLFINKNFKMRVSLNKIAH
jgi:hypothetical protein